MTIRAVTNYSSGRENEKGSQGLRFFRFQTAHVRRGEVQWGGLRRGTDFFFFFFFNFHATTVPFLLRNEQNYERF